MRSRAGVLPSSLSAPRVSARLWLALAAGLGCAVCAYAGLYPRFDEGRLRLVLALTSAPFAAAVVGWAVSARSAAGALGRTLGMSILLGIASTVIPAAILSTRGAGEFVVMCIFGAFFGGATGALYGLPLALLSALGWRHVQAQTHAATDRAARVAGVWGFVVSLVGLAGTLLLDEPTFDPSRGALLAPSLLPALLALAAALAGIAVVVRALTRASRRSSWLARVRSGLEPAFRLRTLDARDRLDALPRISDGLTVVEWCPDGISEATSGTAYRVAAVGTAVAIVDDERLPARSNAA